MTAVRAIPYVADARRASSFRPVFGAYRWPSARDV